MQDSQSNKNTHEIYDLNGDLVAEGNLDYIGEKISVFKVHGLFDKVKIQGVVRIESRISYEEVYNAKVERIEDNRVMLDGIRNISSDLREDLKVVHRGPITLIYTELDENNQKQEHRVEGRMEDLSGGGIGFITEKKFDVGQVLAVKTSIPDLFFEIRIKVLRRESFGRQYKYGCKFHEISKVEESSVRKLVYRLQIENRDYLNARGESV